MNEWLMLGIGVLLTFGTGIFVTSEFSLVNLDRNELESRAKRGEQGLGSVINALKRTATHLSSAQLGITLTTLLTGFTMEPAISKLLESLLTLMGVPQVLQRGVGATVAMVIATLLSMLVGELIPKNFALSVPLAAAKAVAPLQIAFTWCLKPAVWALNGSANAMLRAMGIEPQEELSGARTAEELSSLVKRSAMEGVLESERAVLLARTLRFSDHTAADVMTPRGRVQAISSGATINELLRLARATGHSRFPVTGEDIDEIEGIAHLKDAMAVPLERRDVVPVGAIREEAFIVPETVPLDQLLGDLRSGGFQMAVVLDEYGGTAGVTTLEDLVEEIVGELVDEHDRSRSSVVEGKGSYVFDALLRPDELHEQLNLTIDDEGPYETVAGFLMFQLGRVPEVGNVVTIDEGILNVERMDGRRVDRVRFLPNERYVPRTEVERDMEARRIEHEQGEGER